MSHGTDLSRAPNCADAAELAGFVGRVARVGLSPREEIGGWASETRIEPLSPDQWREAMLSTLPEDI